MQPILAGGLLIGVLCSAWIFIQGLAGFYKDPALFTLFIPIVTVMEVAVLIWALRKTAALGRTYSGQVVAGTLMALIGGVMIICASMLLTSVLVPTFFTDINEMSRQVMRKAGQSEQQINDAIAAVAWTQTSFLNALAGFMGTVMTGVVASAIIAIWVRAGRSGPAVTRG